VKRLLGAVAVVLLVGVGCSSSSSSDGEDASSSTTSSSTSSTTSTTTAAGPALGPIRFNDPGDVRVAEGIVLVDCEGNRPNICVEIDGEPAGDIELIAGFPMKAGDTPASWARDMIDTFRADRADGCPDFDFAPNPVRSVRVAGRPGAAGGFRLLADGDVVEDVRNYYVEVGGQMAVVGADAYARSGGCLPPPEVDPSFSPEQFGQVVLHLDRIVAALVLPEATGDDCPSRPSGTSPAVFDDAAGTYAVTSLEYGDGEVAFDVVQWVSDPEEPNDHRIENRSTQVRTAPVRQGALVLALVDPGGPALEQVEPTDLTTREPSADEVWWLTFDDGSVTEICQQYRP
jgi:hypothetical protein